MSPHTRVSKLIKENQRPIENNFYLQRDSFFLLCVINCVFDFGATINHHLVEAGETKKHQNMIKQIIISTRVLSEET